DGHLSTSSQFTCRVSPSQHRARPGTYTLSLHDALPIFPESFETRESAELRAVDRRDEEEERANPELRGEVRGLERPRREPWRERSEEHTSELQSRGQLVCRPPLEKKKRLGTHDSDSPRL